MGDPWVGKIPWRRAWQPTPVFLPGESHGRKSLEGCSWRGRRVGRDWATKHSAEQCVYVNPSLPIYPPFPSPSSTWWLSTSVILFLFCNELISTTFFDFVYKWYHMILVLLWLTSLRMTISRTIYVAANGVIFFFFMAQQYSIVYMYYHIFSIRSPVSGRLDCFMSWLSWIALQWSLRCMNKTPPEF